ncbi:MAG: substrate-binding domain-containing protein [Mariprofundus sp.]
MMSICMRSLMLVVLMLAAPVARAQIIEIAGSTTVKAFIEPAAEAYRKIHPEVVIRVRGGGSGAGASAVIDGRASLGMMSREPDTDEAGHMQAIERVRIGYDAVAVVVSKLLYLKGHVHGLKREEVAAIYRGEITNWQAVGGPDRRILVIDKEMQRGTRQVFAAYILGGAHAQGAADAVVVGPNRDMKTLLLSSDQAIGFLPFGEAVGDLHALELLEKGQGYMADIASVRDGSYPLSRSLYLLHRKDAPSYVRDFVAYLISNQGQQILRHSGYIPLR